MNHYCDPWFWMGGAEEAWRLVDRTRTKGEPDRPPRPALVRRIVLPLLRTAGLAGRAVEAHPVERKKVAVRESCPCSGDDGFEAREPVFDDGAWALRCAGCGHLDRLRWLSDEARPLVVGLARRRWRLRLGR